MKTLYLLTSVFAFYSSIITTSIVDAVSQTVNIANVNTYMNSQSRIGSMREILYSSAMQFDYSRLNIAIDGFQREPRGRMQDARISLSPYVARDTEFTKLFVHELAHYIDIYTFSVDKN